MAILPEDIPTGKVTGQFYFVNEDTIEDPDQYPQLTVVTGFVRIKASIKVLRMSARKAVIIPLTFDAKFNSEGKLVPADHLDSPEGIYLPATDSTEFDTTGWTWTATFEIKDADTGHTIQIDPITFQVPVGSELDLSTIVPAPASPGVITTRGLKGDPGLDGSNVLPTNDAVAQAIETVGPTKTALSAAIDEKTDPIPAQVQAQVPPLVADAIAADGAVASAAAAAASTAVESYLADGGVATTEYVLDVVENGVAVYRGASFKVDTPTTYSDTGKLPVFGMSHAYVRGSSQGGVSGGVEVVKGYRADGSFEILAYAGNVHPGAGAAAALAMVVSIPDYVTHISVRLYNSTHSAYMTMFPPLVLIGKTIEKLASFLRKFDNVGTSRVFPLTGHPISGAATYKTAQVFTYPGIELKYQVDTIGGAGALYEHGKARFDIVPTNGELKPTGFGFVRLSTFGPTHASYNPGFDAFYEVVPPATDGGTLPSTSVIAGSYLPTPTLKTIRTVTFTDGSNKTAIQYLWHDNLWNFYISSSLHGDKKHIFKWQEASFYGSNPTAFSMGFDKFGNILCVYRTEQLPWTTASDTVRKNPIILMKNDGYAPTVIDFGGSLKPSAWLQDSGFLCTDEYIMLTEYTRPSVATANTWKATYPLTTASNWNTVQSFAVVDPFKHIHNVDRDPFTGYVYTSTGDVDAAAAIYASTNNGDAFTEILSGSEKYCRVLNWVFTKDWIYWATDSSGQNHWLFKAPRLPSGIMDTANIVDLIQFPLDSAPTYATIYMPKIDALLFLGRSDGPVSSVPIDLWDLRTNSMVRLDTLPTAQGTPSNMGFRCESFEYIPRGNEVPVGFSNTIGGGGYNNFIGILGNQTDKDYRVQNLILTVERSGEGFTISYDTSVL